MEYTTKELFFATEGELTLHTQDVLLLSLTLRSKLINT